MCLISSLRARLAQQTSQPELGANPVSLRPPNWPKGGPMGFLDIPGLNIAQKSGEKGWNPANGVPFCARAYICRPRPLGPLGAILKEGSMSDALSTIRCGRGAPSQPTRSEKTYPSGTLPNQHSVLLQLLEDIGRPAEGNSSCFSPARGESMLFRLPVAS